MKYKISQHPRTQERMMYAECNPKKQSEGNVRNQNEITGMKKVFFGHIGRLNSHVSLKIGQHTLDKLTKKEWKEWNRISKN